MDKTISKYTERFLFNTKVRKGDFDWNLLNMSYELTDEQEALKQLNGLIESIVTNNNTYTTESFKSDVEQAAEEVNNG
jgi:hypothetical protein|tara:strand:- start:25 stop:258 length:234 start_codon:yes stop_codon:yes gene_type:complete